MIIGSQVVRPTAAPAAAKRSAIKGNVPLRTAFIGKSAIHPQRTVSSDFSSPLVVAAAAAGHDWPKLAAEMELRSPVEIMDHALKTFGDEIGIAFSGAEDVALIEFAHMTGRKYRVFSLDTGRLNKETYQLFDKVEKHYNIRIEYTFPEAQEVTDLVRAKGLFSFYQDGHQECCRVRKVKPLRKQLKTLKAWITGQRKDQSPDTRTDVPVVQVDPVFEGVTGGAGSLIKYNPLSNYNSAEVWNFLRIQDVPVNELHNQGYVSIGCEPCTRPVLPNQQEREGRWWWEDSAQKECGLHSGNKGYAGEGAEGAEGSKKVERDLWDTGKVTTLQKAQLEGLKNGKRDKDTLVVLYAPWCRFCQGMEAAYGELAEEMAKAGSPVRIAKYRADEDKDYVAANFGLKTFPTIVMLPKGKEGFIKYPSERRDVDSLKMWVGTTAGKEMAHK